MDKIILDTLDTDTMALVTAIKNKLGVGTYKETIDIICECTDKHNLEKLLINLMTKADKING